MTCNEKHEQLNRGIRGRWDVGGKGVNRTEKGKVLQTGIYCCWVALMNMFFFSKENGNGDIKVKRDRYNERKETTSTSLKGSFTEWGTKCLGKERKCK